MNHDGVASTFVHETYRRSHSLTVESYDPDHIVSSCVGEGNGDCQDDNVPLARTLASALKSTAYTLPICPDIRRIVVPVMTSHKNTARSPPALANLALSCALTKFVSQYTVIHRKGDIYMMKHIHTQIARGFRSRELRTP